MSALTRHETRAILQFLVEKNDHLNVRSKIGMMWQVGQGSHRFDTPPHLFVLFESPFFVLPQMQLVRPLRVANVAPGADPVHKFSQSGGGLLLLLLPLRGAFLTGIHHVRHGSHTGNGIQGTPILGVQKGRYSIVGCAALRSSSRSSKGSLIQIQYDQCIVALSFVGNAEHFRRQVGTNQVKINYTPLTLLRAEVHVEIEGVINRQFTFQRARNGIRHTFEGPDVFGNGIAYGRSNYTSQHFYKEALKIRGREFIIDDDYSMSVVWDWLAGDKREYQGTARPAGY